MLMLVSAMSLFLANGVKPEDETLKPLRGTELARRISGKRVETDASTPERLRLQVTEDFYEDGRYLRYSHGRESLGRYRFDGDAVCVTWRDSYWICRIAILDGQGRLWLVRTLEPASFSQVLVTDIPK